MALATQCPHCATTFRVASDQLKLRGGIVRCGACQEIFDGNAALIDLDALAAAAQAVPEAASAHTPDTDQAEPAPDDAAAPVVPAQAGTHAEDAPAPDTLAQAPDESQAEDTAIVPAPAIPPADAADDNVVPADAGTHADAADPVPAETTTPASPVVPADAGTHADAPEPAPHETTTPASPVVPADAGTHADAPEPAPDATTASSSTVAPAHIASPVPDSDSEPIYTLDFDSTFDPFGILPKATAPEEIIEPLNAAAPEGADAELTEAEAEPEPEAPAPPAESPPAIAPDLELRVDEELIAAPLPGDDLHDTEPAATATTADASNPPPVRAPLGSDFPYIPAASIPVRTGPRAKPGRRSKLTPTKIAAPKLRIPETDEPEFVKRSREQEQTGKTRRVLMLVVSALLVLALAAQAVVSFRNVWAARYPAAKPALISVCKLLGCRVQLPAQIDNLAIETGELQTLAPNTYSLTTQLRNNGDLVQAWPNIELALNDANDKPLLRRVFTPAEYLGPGARPGTGFGARAEQPIKLYFELDQLKPSGYHIAVFYP